MRHVLTHELFACKDFLIIYIILSSSIQRILSEFWNLWLVRGALWTPLSDSAITTSRKEHNLWCGILKLYEIHIHWSMFWCYCWCYDGLVFCSWVLISNLKKHITPPPPLPSTVVAPVDITIFLIGAAINPCHRHIIDTLMYGYMINISLCTYLYLQFHVHYMSYVALKLYPWTSVCIWWYFLSYMVHSAWSSKGL